MSPSSLHQRLSSSAAAVRQRERVSARSRESGRMLASDPHHLLLCFSRCSSHKLAPLLQFNKSTHPLSVQIDQIRALIHAASTRQSAMHRATPFPQQKQPAAANPQKRKAAEPLIKPPAAAAVRAPPAPAAAAASASRPQAQLRPAGYPRPQSHIQSTIRQSNAGAAAPAAAAASRPSMAPPRQPPPLLQPRPPPPPQRKIITVPRAQPAAAAAAASRPVSAQPKPAAFVHRPAAAVPPTPQLAPRPPAPQPARQSETRPSRVLSKKKDKAEPKPQRQDINEKDLPFEQSQKHAPSAKAAKSAKSARPAKPSKRLVLDLTEDAKGSFTSCKSIESSGRCSASQLTTRSVCVVLCSDSEDEEAEAEAQADRERPPQTLTEWLESSPRASPEPSTPAPLAEPVRTFGHPDVLSVVVILGEERDALEAELHARPGAAESAEEDDDADSPEPVRPADSLFPWVLRLLHRTRGLTWSCLCGALPLHCNWSRLRSHIRRAHGGIEETGREDSPSPSSSSAAGDDNEDSEMQASGDEAAANSAAVGSGTHELVALPSNLLPPREPSHMASSIPSSTWPPTRRRAR